MAITVSLFGRLWAPVLALITNRKACALATMCFLISTPVGISKPGGGPLYDMTGPGLHAMTGIFGAAKRVTALSGNAIPQREFKGEMVELDVPERWHMLLDFGNTQYAFVYGTATGMLAQELATRHSSAPKAKIKERQTTTERRLITRAAPVEEKAAKPICHTSTTITRASAKNTFSRTLLQLVVGAEGTPTLATPEHARHVIDVVESGGARAAETGQTQTFQQHIANFLFLSTKKYPRNSRKKARSTKNSDFFLRISCLFRG